ncbi:MAG: hypothetical protein GX748_08970 [Lentisphaerae bacterium]|nr:hypothetical protein [Lentisphaerota bacterium]
MTLIELGIVMGIVSVLLALVLGLARHVNAVVKIRRAQADLGEWHETIDRWRLRFGEYPHARINTTIDSVGSIEPLDSFDFALTDSSRFPLAILTNRCEVVYPQSTITFRSFLTSDLSITDPWGMPYLYFPADNARSYTLYSCGPDRQTLIGNRRVPSGAAASGLDPTLDDIYFER